MALKPTKHFVLKNGEFRVNPSTGAYVGGHPLIITSSGIERITGASGRGGVIGVSSNDSTTDIANGKATFYAFPILLEMYQKSDETIYPYDETRSYAVGTEITASGTQWAPAVSTDQVYGIVMDFTKSGTDTTALKVLFFNQGYVKA